MNGLVPIRGTVGFRDPITGRMYVGQTPHVGADSFVDGDPDELGWDDVGEDEVGAPGGRRRRQQRRMERQGDRRERRDDRWERRWERKGLDPDGDDDDLPRSKGKTVETLVGGNYTVSAAGAWSITLTPPVSGLVIDLLMEFPTGTFVQNVATGLSNAINGQTISAQAFQATSTNRGSIKGLKVQAGTPITISGTTTATSGTINATFTVRTSDRQC